MSRFDALGTGRLVPEPFYICAICDHVGEPRRHDARAPAPKRIQRQRTKGWRMPEGAIYVGRPTRWGNPWRIGDLDPSWCGQSVRLTEAGVELGPLDAAGAVYHFRVGAADLLTREPDWLAPLRGHDLACWCPFDQPCHADVLLQLANEAGHNTGHSVGQALRLRYRNGRRFVPIEDVEDGIVAADDPYVVVLA